MAYVKQLNTTLSLNGTHGPKVVDLFAGCGGLALGFEAQGFETIGYEMNGDACATYARNLKGECHQIYLTPETPLPKAKVIIGGPPCQPFSVGGHQKGLIDSRDGFPVFISAVAKLNPDIWIFENVRGLMYRNKWYLDEVLNVLRSLGYIIEYRILNAVNYGVPQNRERLFVVGHRGKFRFPEPLNYTVTAGDAVGDTANLIPPESKFLTASMDEYVAKYERASMCVVPRDLHLDRPSRTVTCRNLAGATGDMMRVRLPDGRRRRILLREAARLQSFPDWFEFIGNETSTFNQIGNAVPPLLAYNIAGSVKEYLNSEFRLSVNEINKINAQYATPIEGVNMDQSSLFDNSDVTREPINSDKKDFLTVSNKGKGKDGRRKNTPQFLTKTEDAQKLVNETLYIVNKLGIPVDRLTPRKMERLAIAILALADVKDSSEWKNTKDKDSGYFLGTREIIAYVNKHFNEKIADSSYDDIRRQDLEWPILAGLVVRSKAVSARNDPTR